MNGPKKIRFGDLGEVISGQHIPSDEYTTTADGAPYLTGPADFTDRVPRISKWTKTPRSFAQRGDVLLTVKGAGCGKSNLGVDAAIGRQLMALRPDPSKLDRDFLFAVIQSQEPLIARLGQGATVPGIAKPDVEDIGIPWFPIADQKRIAAVLERADRLRRLRRNSVVMSEDLPRPLFETFFGDMASPGKWQAQRLSDLIKDGPQNGIYKPASAYGEGVRILRIDGFYDGSVTDLDACKRVRLSSQEVSEYGLRENDLIINRVNSRPFLGKSAIIPRLREPLVFESNMMRFAVDSGQINPRFLIHYLQTAFVRKQIQILGKDAVNQASINQEDVKSLIVRVPPSSLQDRFVNAIRMIERLASKHRESLRQAEHLFQTLLHRAFKGGL